MVNTHAFSDLVRFLVNHVDESKPDGGTSAARARAAFFVSKGFAAHRKEVERSRCEDAAVSR
jgi:hypothetical protein